MAKPSGQGSPGPSVDRRGNEVVDPTPNVLDLVQASVKRLDDLAAMQEKCYAALAAVNEKLIEQQNRRQDDLRTLLADHTKDFAILRARYDEQLREAESKRIDAIRSVDVAAVQRAAEVSVAQASTLATQVQTSADTLRTQVAAAATAAAASLIQALEPIQSDIRDLRKTQSEGVGAKETKTEVRGLNQWVIGLLIGVALALVLHFLPAAGLVAPVVAP